MTARAQVASVNASSSSQPMHERPAWHAGGPLPLLADLLLLIVTIIMFWQSALHKVSNLLVVLCSEQATQQVVTTGTLYS